MNIEEFILKIEEEFEDIEPKTLKPESNFREFFEWNSINALIIIAMIKTEYNVALNADDLTKAKTINDIFNVVKKRAA
jgi:acyl carrier protein